MKIIYLISFAILVFLIALWLIGPIIITQAYHGDSLSIVNSVITGQKIHPLSKYLSEFQSMMIFSTVIILWSLILFNHFIVYVNRNSFNYGNFNLTEIDDGKKYLTIVIGYTFLTLASLFFLIVFHGKTYLSIMTHDTFVYFDGAYRLSQGQVPHKDFHTPLGAVAYLLPYLGLMMKKSFAGSLELSSFFLAIFVASCLILFLRGRASALISVLTIIMLLFLVMVPMNTGNTGNDLTHAMFYNRLGWVSLTIIFISYVLPKTNSLKRIILEALIIAILLNFLFFLKITYFIFGIIFLVLLALKSRQQMYIAIYSGTIAFIILLIMEWNFEIVRPYFQDLNSSITASGAVRSNLMRYVLDNSMQYLCVVIVFFCAISSQTMKKIDFIFIAFVSLAGLAIINQNAQKENIVILFAILFWGYALSVKIQNNEKAHIMLVLLLLFLIPNIIFGLRGIYNFTLGVGRAALSVKIDNLSGVYIDETFSLLYKTFDETDSIDLFNQIRSKKTKQPLSQGEYIETVSHGVNLINSKRITKGKILTFDLANPFNFLTQTASPTGDYSWFHAGRNISKNSYLPANKLFQDVNYVMIPTFPMAAPTKQMLLNLYGNYLKNNYKKFSENKYWSLYVRNDMMSQF